MRILLLNPNTTAAMTDRLLTAAMPVVSPGTILVPMTATRGVPYIATRAEAQIAGLADSLPKVYYKLGNMGVLHYQPL